MSKIKTVSSSDKNIFEDKVNELLNSGYSLMSASCRFVNNDKYDYCDVWQAILITKN